MNRCKVDKTLNTCLHFLGYDAALLKEVATLYDTMTNSINLIEALKCTKLWVEKYLEYECYTLFVGWKVSHNLLLLTIIKFHLDECLIESDTLNTTLSQYRLICHIVQFVLNGTTTAV